MTEATEAKGRVLTEAEEELAVVLESADAHAQTRYAAKLALTQICTLREAICGLDWRDWLLLAEHAERQPNIQENVVEALRRLAQVRRGLE